ncbi:trypco2 family protein [Streptomyces sp. NPDC002073]
MDGEKTDVIGYGLGEVLEAVSGELVAAQQRTAEQGGFGLMVDSVEIELAITVVGETRTAGRAGLSVRVLPLLNIDVGGERASTLSDTRMNRIKLVLHATGGPVGA